METLLAVLVLLGLIAVSNIVNRFIPFVPIPLIQIGLGVLVVLIPPGIHMELEPELFFVLFIAPLLFNDGRRTPRAELWNLRAPILMLALGLVFATVLVAGYAIHWMIPSIPLAAAFALAAILSPTDAVAVSAIAGRVHLPKSIHRVLEGESLMNDASGLVAFKFAIAAAVTGVFSLRQATFSFILIAVGGLVAGAVLAFLLIRLSVFIRKLGMEDVTVHTLLQILTPFIIYLVSEELGLSGILAVVAGGVIYAIEKDRAVSPQYKLQLVSASTWSVLLFILNGMVFLILGVSIPDVISVVYRDSAVDNWMVFGYVLAITVLLIVLRFLWVYGFTLWMHRGEKAEKRSLKEVLITSISGVRGAVTLAGAFSIPLVLGDGSPFPERNLMIFLAAGCILMSLLIASIFLPALAGKGEEGAGSEEGSEQAAKSVVIDAGMAMMRSMMDGDSRDSAQPALNEFKEKIQKMSLPGQDDDPAAERMRQLGMEARIVGLHAERKALNTLIEKEEVPAGVAEKMTEMLDYTEAFFAKHLNSQIRLSLSEVGRVFSGMFAGQRGQVEGWQAAAAQYKEVSCKAKLVMSQAAVAAIRDHMNEENREASQHVIDRYEMLMARLSGDSGWTPDGVMDARKLEVKLKAIQEQRDKVQQMYQEGAINRKVAGRLRHFVDHLEASIWED
ncbi:Na+/H+ antiporter [Paenibacillus sp. NPDC056722]|uniref:Na+/H+ antiporter n=1 Tax=Paenibacillus sp. NPDC056722 TaxID=3345924 RepID=UPI0036A3C4B8